MQFIESNSFNLRAAVYQLTHPNNKLQFHVFPMVHVGEAEYYSEIQKRLSHCEYILYEGVRSFYADLITLSYRKLAEKRGLGLMTQKEGLRLNELNAQLIHADMSTEEFEKEWSELSIWTRISIWVLCPLMGLLHRFLGHRVFLACVGNVNDLPEGGDLCSEESPFFDLIMSKRDRRLIECVEKEYRSKSHLATIMGIVYGAKHIPVVMVLLLQKYGYRVAKAEWVKVADVI